MHAILAVTVWGMFAGVSWESSGAVVMVMILQGHFKVVCPGSSLKCNANSLPLSTVTEATAFVWITRVKPVPKVRAEVRVIVFGLPRSAT